MRTPDPDFSRAGCNRWKICLALFAMWAFLALPAAANIVGTLPGALSVDNKGMANYSIPLQLLPGRGGLVPSVSLAYNSGSGNGAVGVGWGIQTGFPQTISRGRTILARDGFAHGIDFSDDDRLYLDGKRLILVSGAYWTIGSQYRTEVDSFVHITALGANGATSGTGEIEAFKLEAKDGTISYYGKIDGNAADARHYLGGVATTYAWTLKRVDDAVGNRIEFFYNAYSDAQGATGEHVLARIEYTSNPSAGVAAAARVRFLYTPDDISGSSERSDVFSGYMGGGRTETRRRLGQVDIETNNGGTWALARYYELTYAGSPGTSRSRLDRVQVYARENTSAAWDSVPATVFTYDDTNAGAPFASPSATPFAGTDHDALRLGYPITSASGDFNGDGRPDKFVFGSGLYGKVYLGAVGGFVTTTPQFDFVAATGGIPSFVKAADIDGDGRSELIWMRSGDQNTLNNVYAARWTASGFVGIASGGSPYLAMAGSQMGNASFEPMSAAEFPDAFASRVSTGDFNGDGRADLLIHCGNEAVSYSNKGLYVALSHGDGFNAPVRWCSGIEDSFYSVIGVVGPPNDPQYYTHSAVRPIEPMVADFNGDGVDDYSWITRELIPDPLSLTTCRNYQIFVWVVLSRPKVGGFSPPHVVFSQHNDDHPGTLEGADVIFNCLRADCDGDGAVDLLILGKKQDPNRGTGWGLTDWMLLRGGRDGSSGWAQFDKVENYLPLQEGLAGVGDSVTFNLSYMVGWNSVIPPGQGYSAVEAAYLDFFQDEIVRNLNDSLETEVTGYGVSPDETGGYYFTQTTDWVPNAYIESGSMFLHDVNRDGRADYVWAVNNSGWWVKYATANGFGSAQLLVPFSAGDLDSAFGSGYLAGSTRGVTIEPVDPDGDGVTDWVLGNEGSPALVFLAGRGPVWDRLTGIANGLGSTTTVAYLPVTDDTVYTSGVSVSYPIRELRTPQQVVSDVWRDAGGGSSAHFVYQYSGRRLDLSGRGDLGFHSFVTLDTQTNLFKYQFLAQSFPMTGLTAREETYRYLGSGQFRFLNSHDNTVVFDEVVKSPSDSTSWGTLYPFVSKAVEYRWENDTSAHFTLSAGGPSSQPEALFPQAKPSGEHIRITAESWFDNQASTQTTLPGAFNPSDVNGSGQNAVTGVNSYGDISSLTFPRLVSYGNLRRLYTDYGAGHTETVTTDYKSPVGAMTGLVDNVATTVTSPSYGTESAPVKRYTYWGSTPLVETETIDAADNTLDYTTTYTRDTKGRVTDTSISGYNNTGSEQHIGSYSVSSATAFDDRFDLPTTARNAAPYLYSTTTAYHPLFGLPTSVTDVNNAETTTQYDALGRTIQVRDVLKNLQTDTGFAWNTTQTVSPPAGVTGLAETSAYSVTVTTTVQPSVTTGYDRLGRPIRVIKTGFNGQQTLADTVYNTLGQVVAVSNPYPSGGTVYWTKTTYDAMGRISTVTAPNGTVTTNSYHGRATQVSVDAPNLGGVDPAAQVNTTLVDAKGRTVKVWNADNAPALSGAVTDIASPAPSIAFALDGFGRMRATTLKDQSQQITASYDALGRQTALNDPDKGPWSYLNNALGQVVRQTDARTTVTTSTFDHLGRPLTRTTAESSGPVETAKWYYYHTADNASLQLVTQGAKGWIGALQRDETSTSGAPGYAAANSAVTNVHYYDAKGRPEIALRSIDSKWFYTHTGYDAYSRVHEVRHYWRPPGHETAADWPYVWKSFGYTYAYDSRSYVTSVTDSASRSWWADPSYDHLDRVTSVKKGNGHVTTRDYRPADGVLTAITTGSVQSLVFNYDGLGNLTYRSGAGSAETLTYDNLNRLTSSTKQGATGYYANGNIRNKTGIAGQTTADYSYDATHPHAVSAAFGYAHGYDANGNLTTRSNGAESWTLAWTGFDKPRWMAKNGSGSEFLYNANRSRVEHLEFDSMSGAPSHYTRKKIYAAGPEVEAGYVNTAATGAPVWQHQRVRVYLPGPDGTVGAAEFATGANGSVTESLLVYHHDHLGSVESITPHGSTAGFATDPTGKSGRFSEDAWGARRDPLDWVGAPAGTTDDGGADSLTPRGFTGHEMLDGLGLVHMNGRIYDALLGRFLSADIFVQEPSNLQAYNRYSYVFNNPLTRTDPSGWWNIWNPLTYGLPSQPGENPWSIKDSSAEWGATAQGASGGAQIYANSLSMGATDALGVTNAGALANDSDYNGSRIAGGVGSTALMIATGGTAAEGSAVAKVVFAGMAAKAASDGAELAGAGAAQIANNPASAEGYVNVTLGTASMVGSVAGAKFVGDASAGVNNAAPKTGNTTTVDPKNAPSATAPKEGSFSITERGWQGYPSNPNVPRPAGPFRLLEGAEKDAARSAANNANRATHRADPSLAGKEIHEIQPVKFDGSPTNPANKVPLTPQEHRPFTTWWRQLQRDLEKK